MNRSHSHFVPFPALVVAARTPLMPTRTVCDVYESPDPLAALRELLKREPLLQQAIFVASPSLSSCLADDPGSPPQDRALLSALGYLSRISSRCTPFGLCAGIGLVNPGSATTLSFADAKRSTNTRFDMQFLDEIAQSLQRGDHRESIAFVANKAVLERGGRLYVTNIHLSRESGPTQPPVTLKNTKAVRFVRDLTQVPMTYASIVSDLAREFDAPAEEAALIVDRLIECGVLLNTLRPSPVGDPTAYVMKQTARIDRELSQRLASAQTLLESIDAAPLSDRSLGMYQAAAAELNRFTDAEVRVPFQVDMHVSFEGTLSQRVISDASLLAEYLVRASASTTLAKFRQRFTNRYEGRERLVPLLELVDDNLGLGSPDALERIPLRSPEREELLAGLVDAAVRDGQTELLLSDKAFNTLVPPLAEQDSVESLDLVFSVAARSPAAIESGEYLIAPGAYPGSNRACRFLGRFLHLFGEDGANRVREVAAAASASNAITAELVFAPPRARSYNVCIRPRIYDHEICVGVGEPSQGDDISLDDLWVGIDDDAFFLWSQSRRRRVIPIESHVLNTSSTGPNLCRFLACLAADGRRSIGSFDWGAVSTLPFLPRLRRGRIVLSLARWRVPTQTVATIDEARRTLGRLRSNGNAPRYLHLRERDNQLLLDLDAPISAALVAHQVDSTTRYTEFVEAFPAPDQTWLPGSSGKHNAEFVVALARREEVRPKAEPRTATPMLRRKRFGPGSRWLYSKLYVARQAAEDLLLNAVAPLVRQFQGSFSVIRWFFVRYSDDAHHLRVRFLSPHEHSRDLRDAFLQRAEQWLDEERITRYTLDTYDPEYERYGGLDRLDAAELFFTNDSETCVQLLRGLDHGTDARVAAAVESFVPWLYEDSKIAELALSAFATGANRKLSGADRASLKRLLSIEREGASGLAAALAGDERERRLASFFHMHCNRIGLSGLAESRANTLLRAVVLGRRARENDRSPAPA